MKTEFLKEILGDIPEDKQKEVIDAIMAENGKDVNTAKAELKNVELERDTFKEQLETAQGAIKEFEGLDAEGLKTQIAELNTKLSEKDTELETAKAEHTAELAKKDFVLELEKKIEATNPYDPADIKNHLDIDALMKSQNQSADIDAALGSIKESKAHLFKSDEPFQNPVAPGKTETPPGDSQTAIMRAAAGLPAEPKGDK